MMALGTYGEFTTGGYFNEGQWPVNPYNKVNGGPAATPADFWTDAQARTLYRRRLRYLIARYGPETSLAFWEFWNETDAPAPWVAEMATYLKANDPYRHLVTNSYSTTGTPAVWNLPQIDFTQTHRYGDEGTMKDIAPVILDDARQHDRYASRTSWASSASPGAATTPSSTPPGIGTNLHNGLWASALAGNAGGASIWWWDSYVEPKNQYPRFTGLARFAATVDWPRRRFAPLDAPAADARAERARNLLRSGADADGGLGREGDRAGRPSPRWHYDRRPAPIHPVRSGKAGPATASSPCG